MSMASSTGEVTRPPSGSIVTSPATTRSLAPSCASRSAPSASMPRRRPRSARRRGVEHADAPAAHVEARVEARSQRLEAALRVPVEHRFETIVEARREAPRDRRGVPRRAERLVARRAELVGEGRRVDVQVDADAEHRGRAARRSASSPSGCRRSCGRREHVVRPLDLDAAGSPSHAATVSATATPPRARIVVGARAVSSSGRSTIEV